MIFKNITVNKLILTNRLSCRNSLSLRLKKNNLTKSVSVLFLYDINQKSLCSFERVLNSAQSSVIPKFQKVTSSPSYLWVDDFSKIKIKTRKNIQISFFLIWKKSSYMECMKSTPYEYEQKNIFPTVFYFNPFWVKNTKSIFKIYKIFGIRL